MSSWSQAKAIHEAKQRMANIEKVRERKGLAEAIKQFSLIGEELEVTTRREKIDSVWAECSPAHSRKDHSGERKMLYDILDTDESLNGLVGGTFRQDTDRMHKHRGVAVATDRRVLFLDKGVLGSTERMEIAYENIESVTTSTGMMFAGVQVVGRGASSYRIEDIAPKEAATKFVDVVRGHLGNAGQKHTKSFPKPQPGNALDDLERLANLFERGLLTQEEFDNKKKELLG